MAQAADIYQFPPSERVGREKRGPQLEDGHTRIANELLDALCMADFTAREFRVVSFVIRQTYGWNVKSKRMASSFIANGTGLHASDCSKVLNELIRRNVIIRHGGSRSPISVNKHFDQWLRSETGKKQAPTKRPQSGQDALAKSGQDALTKKDMKDKPPLTTFEGECAQGENHQPAAAKKPQPKPAKKTKTKAIDLSNLPEGVSAEAVQGFIEHRTALKKPLTQRALTLNVNEALRAAERIPGMTADQAFDETVLAGWQGVKAQWLVNRLGGAGKQPARQGDRKGFAQPLPTGSYTPTDMDNLPDWMRD